MKFNRKALPLRNKSLQSLKVLQSTRMFSKQRWYCKLLCQENCEPVIKPVCGSNGKTFNNLCELKKYGCELNEDITAIYFGVCGKI